MVEWKIGKMEKEKRKKKPGGRNIHDDGCSPLLLRHIQCLTPNRGSMCGGCFLLPVPLVVMNIYPFHGFLGFVMK